MITWRKPLSLAWLVGFGGYFFFLTNSIFISQSFLGVTLFLFVLDRLVHRSYSSSHSEKIVYRFVFAFVGLSFLSGVINAGSVDAIFALKEEWLFVLIPLGVYAARDEIWRERLIKILLISTAIMSLLAIMQHFAGFPTKNPPIVSPDGGFRSPGLFDNTLTFGNLIALLSIFFLSLGFTSNLSKYRIVYAGTGFLAGVATLFTYNRGPVTALFVTVIALTVFNARREWKFSLAVVGGLIAVALIFAPGITKRFGSPEGIFVTEDSGIRQRSTARTVIWKTAATIILEDPVFGVGQGNFLKNYQTKSDSTIIVTHTHAHNDILNIAAYAGIPTALVFIGMWVAVIRLFYRSVRNGSAGSASYQISVAALFSSICFAICSMSEATFADEEVRAALMAIWGFGLWSVENTGCSDRT
ncbi:MAG: O-antigen ligase family protein [candidate division Zixibacteria bacterium]|nr:O-antigen ligase family protein [candidate division Zixibacteria bacterium]